MTEITKDRFTRITQTIIAMLGGAILTMMLNTASETKANTSDIAVIKSQIEPLKDIPQRLASLETKSDRNYDTLQRVEGKIDGHISLDKK